MDEPDDIFTSMADPWRMVPNDAMDDFKLSIDTIAELFPLMSGDLDKLAFLHMVEKLIVMRAGSIQGN